MSKIVISQVLLIVSVAVGQQRSVSAVKVLTVCEVLAHWNRYADTAVALVGRMERSVSMIDHHEFMSQDQCDHPVVTHGHIFPSKIEVVVDWEEGMPKPPSDRPKLQDAVVAAKLSAVRKTTRLGTHQEPRHEADGHWTTTEVPNEWVVVYGRIVRLPRVDKDCGAEGCGGDDIPLGIIADPGQIHKLRESPAN
jgi:hypothetical protein